jgi:hypothetical protein
MAVELHHGHKHIILAFDFNVFHDAKHLSPGQIVRGTGQAGNTDQHAKLQNPLVATDDKGDEKGRASAQKTAETHGGNYRPSLIFFAFSAWDIAQKVE